MFEFYLRVPQEDKIQTHSKCIIMKLFIILLCFQTGTLLLGQSAHSHLRDGDRAYLENNFSKAEEGYRKALAKEDSYKGSFNLGNSIYNQNRNEEAIRHFQNAISKTSDPTIKAGAYHNLGNAYFNDQQFDKSVEAYKNSLRLNPSDLDTKKNLALAMKVLQQQEQQQQQQQESENADKQEDQQQQEQPKPQEEEQQDQNQDQPNDQTEDENQDLEEQDLTKEEAEQLLKIMDQEEQRVQEKLRKAKSKNYKSKKDW